ncbi:MAG: hypothetical protein IT439_06630 [Phycisphaerales bacterium]|nr:hypothetical protein [Phycisphaerales bacterium]
MPVRPLRRHTPQNRPIRSLWLRGVLALVLIPVLVLGAFRGTTFVSHTVEGHGAHLHASSSVAKARSLAEQHQFAHASGSDSCGAADRGSMRPAASGEDPAVASAIADFPAAPGETDGLVITIPDFEPLVPRGLDVTDVILAAPGVQGACAPLWMPPEICEEPGSPGGASFDARPRLGALTTVARLMRIDGALLL